jgi:hypothetical protein
LRFIVAKPGRVADVDPDRGHPGRDDEIARKVLIKHPQSGN